MRIISPFHDYYDSAMGLGMDDTSVFLRRPEPLEVPRGHDYDLWEHPLKRYMEYTHNAKIGPFGNVGHHRRREFISEPNLLMVAGRLYPFMMLGDEHCPENNSIAWSLEELTDWLATHGITLGKYRAWWSNGVKDEQRAKNWFTLRGEDATAAMAEAGVALVHIANHDQVFGRSGNVEMTINPKLGDFGFAKQVDPWSLYQELTMFVEGILRHPDPVTVPITDKDRLVQHGFDKWSFKTMPTVASLAGSKKGRR